MSNGQSSVVHIVVLSHLSGHSVVWTALCSGASESIFLNITVESHTARGGQPHRDRACVGRYLQRSTCGGCRDIIPDRALIDRLSAREQARISLNALCPWQSLAAARQKGLVVCSLHAISPEDPSTDARQKLQHWVQQGLQQGVCVCEVTPRAYWHVRSHEDSHQKEDC